MVFIWHSRYHDYFWTNSYNARSEDSFNNFVAVLGLGREDEDLLPPAKLQTEARVLPIICMGKGFSVWKWVMIIAVK